MHRDLVCSFSCSTVAPCNPCPSAIERSINRHSLRRPTNQIANVFGSTDPFIAHGCSDKVSADWGSINTYRPQARKLDYSIALLRSGSVKQAPSLHSLPLTAKSIFHTVFGGVMRSDRPGQEHIQTSSNHKVPHRISAGDVCR